MSPIAIANRSPLIRIALLQLFHQAGYPVIEMPPDKAGWALFLTGLDPLPDILFIDADLYTKEIPPLLTDRYPGMKPIVFSLFNHEKHIIDHLRSGVSGYLTGDCGPDEILLAVQTVRSNLVHIPAKLLEEWKIPASYKDPLTRKKWKTQLLSDREYEFLGYCASDLSYKEIARYMGVGYKTIDNFRAAVGSKLQIQTRAGLAVYAERYGLKKTPQ